jgi:histidinol-phosphate phosphatase family protein
MPPDTPAIPQISPQRPAVFLDRDGVINESLTDYVKCWEEFHFLPLVFEAFQILNASSYLVIVITNQSMVGRGIATFDAVADIHGKMLKRIFAEGGRVDGIYVCPHSPADACVCRKPQTTLYRQAAREHGIDLAHSVCIGDKLSDLIPGDELGCKGILVKTGETDASKIQGVQKYLIRENFLTAVKSIVE